MKLIFIRLPGIQNCSQDPEAPPAPQKRNKNSYEFAPAQNFYFFKSEHVNQQLSIKYSMPQTL